MSKYFLILAGVFISLNALSQTGIIKGKISTSEGKPIEFVSVVIKGTNKGSLSNVKGEYLISEIPEGEQTILIIYSGTNSVEKSVNVKSGQSLILDFQLEEKVKELQSVEIFGRIEKDYKSDFSFSGTKMEMKSVDIPQSISTVTKEAIKDQQAYRLNDVAKLAAGVNQFSTYDDITMRGFRNSEFRLINGMRMTPNFWSSPLLVNIERVEFLK
jgi:iron complex outermembrane receptor protein